jgi:DNA invertase Pin-like site-specific DNA recombinase
MPADMDYTTALYLRLSVDDDNIDESNSIKSQRDLLQRFVAADPVLSSGGILEFNDDGWSGTTFERPQVRELLALTRRGGIRCIIVKDLSRWGRNYIEVCEYIEQIFPFLGVRFISLNDRYDSEDFKGSTAPVDVAFNSLAHDVYYRELSFKVRQSYVTKAKKGEFLCGEAPFGFVKSTETKNQLVIDEEAAAIVRRIYGMALDGMGTMRIAAVLNEEGVETPLMYRRRRGRTPRGGHHSICGGWTDKNVRTILSDERYTGVQVSGKTRKPKPGSRNTVCLPESEWIKVPGAHERIISDEAFKEAKAGIRRYSKTHTSPKSRALFAGKTRCGHCGRALRHQPNANPYHYCNSARVSVGAGCSNGRFFVDDIKVVVLAAVQAEARKVLDTRKKLAKAISGPSNKVSAGTEIKQAATRIALLERHGISLYEDFADEKIDRDTYLSAKAACAAELNGLRERADNLRTRLASIPETQKPSNSEPLLQRILDARDVTDEVLSLVECVTIYDTERIEVRLAFGDTNI